MKDFKLFRDKYHAVSTTKSMLALLIEELDKNNDQEDFEIWYAAENLKFILDKWEKQKYKL